MGGLSVPRKGGNIFSVSFPFPQRSATASRFNGVVCVEAGQTIIFTLLWPGIHTALRLPGCSVRLWLFIWGCTEASEYQGQRYSLLSSRRSACRVSQCILHEVLDRAQTGYCVVYHGLALMANCDKGYIAHEVRPVFLIHTLVICDQDPCASYLMFCNVLGSQYTQGHCFLQQWFCTCIQSGTVGRVPWIPRQ